MVGTVAFENLYLNVLIKNDVQTERSEKDIEDTKCEKQKIIFRVIKRANTKMTLIKSQLETKNRPRIVCK